MMHLIRVAVILITFLIPALSLSADNPSPQTPEKFHLGTVKKAETGGQYVYMEIEENGKSTWIATYSKFLGGEVRAGDKVQYSGGVRMTNFASKALNKTFDTILFITKIKKMNAPRLNDFDHVPADSYHMKFATGGQKNVSAPLRGEIEKAEKGKNIEEIYADLERLNGKEVIIKAKVMKINTMILGKNWITLQDGTGTAPDNRITAATQGMASPGDVITVKGTLKKDFDLGSGYKYKVLIDEAEITK